MWLWWWLRARPEGPEPAESPGLGKKLFLLLAALGARPAFVTFPFLFPFLKGETTLCCQNQQLARGCTAHSLAGLESETC